ncbi:2Fe-2S iron-sulfur cluster-binding protein [Nonomuraea deserti]|uniref:2Fe-2S iron-sulfur cluster-binding protein n=1 Tax=Nonomuraea deserti TaxID=1848322 RepID=UPI003F6E3778
MVPAHLRGPNSDDGELHPVQRAFNEQDAFRCGYCTPGQIMRAVRREDAAPPGNTAALE